MSRRIRKNPESRSYNNAAEALDVLYDFLYNSGLETERIQLAGDVLDYFSYKSGLTEGETIIFAVMFHMADCTRVSVFDLASIFDVPFTTIMERFGDLQGLILKGAITRNPAEHSENRRSPETYMVSQSIIDWVLQDCPYKLNSRADDIDAFYDELSKVFANYNNRLYETTVSSVKTLLKAFTCIKYGLLDFFGITDPEVLVLFYALNACVNGGIKELSLEQICGLLPEGSNRKYMEKALLDKSNVLRNYSFLVPVGSMQPNLFKVGKWGHFIFARNVQKAVSKQNNCIISYNSIQKKELFFNCAEDEQIDKLKLLLGKQELPNVMQRMEQKGLRKGFACLFYGAPGTGKTESVRQLALDSERDIMFVDISSIKSKWVGESEKNIKAVFENYRQLVSDCDNTPILLFNEADAIFGSRLENTYDASDIMENAVQNIILQEMEVFEGILIATTNLQDNLDKAFERRFLFKVRFERPTEDTRLEIWKSNLPHLDERALLKLSKYELSGGNIENITRKSTIDFILKGREANESELMRYCENEILVPCYNELPNKVGFIQ